METASKTTITVETNIEAPLEKVWNFWTEPEHIKNWNSASDDWHTPYAENDVRTGGKFKSRMEARDGSMGFDFGGIYDDVRKNQYIEYTMDDGRRVQVTFSPVGDGTNVVETFEAETTNSAEMQQNGWQAILDNFKRYTEAH